MRNVLSGHRFDADTFDEQNANDFYYDEEFDMNGGMDGDASRILSG